MPTISPSVLPVLMLFASNVFMTFAWYGHLKFKASWLPVAVLVSWLLGFVSEGAAGVESRTGFCADRRRCVSDFSQMVVRLGS